MNPDSRTRQDNLKYIDFPSIEDVSIDSIDQERSLDRQAYTQQTLVEGSNKAILLSDGTNTRILIGYQKNGF